MKNRFLALLKKTEENEKLREVIMYLFFGGLTSLISIVLYAVFYKIGLSNLRANAASLFFAILFAFVTNRRWVFKRTEASFLKEAGSFYLSRLATSLLEMLIMYVFVDLLAFDNFIVKIVATFIVIVLNYIFSKFLVFRKAA